MKRTNLGEFEELVLLIIGAMDGKAYGVPIKNKIKEQTGREASVGALHSALYRLEDKGMIEAEVGGATAERGGRRKKFYRITNVGKQALVTTYTLREGLLKQIPDLNFN